MKRVIIKEVVIYLFLFIILSLLMHYKEWFSHPVEHLKALPHSQFGLFHPLIFSFGIYIFILIIKIFIKIIKKAIEKGSKTGV